MRDLLALSALPAVAVTAFTRSEDRVRSRQAGNNTHVAKPLELLAVISALVRSGPSQ